MSHTYAVFYSPGAGDSSQLTQLKDAFKKSKLTAKFYPISDCKRLGPTLTADVLVAAGGDGTVNSVATMAHNCHKTLAVVPLGTLNHFAKDMSLPTEPLKAIKLIAAGKMRHIDIGMVNDTLFLNNSSIGLYPSLVRTRAKWEKRIGKWPAAVLSMLLVAKRSLRLHEIRLTVDGKTIKRKSLLLFVGNNTYSLKGVGLPSRSDLWHGELHIYMLKTKRLDRLAKTVVYMFLGKKLPERYLERFEAKQLVVKTASKKHVWLAYDGEVSATTSSLSFRLMPRALKVITDNPTA